MDSWVDEVVKGVNGFKGYRECRRCAKLQSQIAPLFDQIGFPYVPQGVHGVGREGLLRLWA